jgi:hypothetical protein
MRTFMNMAGSDSQTLPPHCINKTGPIHGIMPVEWAGLLSCNSLLFSQISRVTSPVRLAPWLAPAPSGWPPSVGTKFPTSSFTSCARNHLVRLPLGHSCVSERPCAMVRVCRVLALILLLLPSSRAAAQYQHEEQIPRHVIVNGSVGLKGREVAFLNITNLQQETLTAVVSIVQPSGVVAVKSFTVASEAMLPINIAAAFPELGSTATFSVALDIAGDSEYGYDVSAAAAMVWYRAASLPDLEQVAESKAEIRVSTKR